PPATNPTTLGTTIPATRPAPQVAVNIEEARAFALRNNLDLSVSLLDPTIARQNVSEAEARFESLFTTRVGYSVSDVQTSSSIVGSQNKSLSIQPGIQVPLRTGGTISIDAPMNRSETN